MLLILSLFAAPAFGADNAKRFLFIIDTSAGMKPMEMPMRETLFDLIYSGARGNMTNGDTYGIWLVSDRIDTSFPMEMWKHRFAVEIAAKAVSHMKDHGLKGKPSLELAMADAKRIAKNVGDLTVILVSNGETPIGGTPFDERINARFQELTPAMKAAKVTLNTVMVAQDGEFVAWGMNSPGFLIDVPRLPPKRKPSPALVARTTVEPGAPRTTAPVGVAAVPAPPPKKPSVAAAPIIITKETVAQERKSYLASIMTTPVTETVPVATPITNPVVATTAAVIATNVPMTVETNQTNVATGVTPNPTSVIASKLPTAPASVTNTATMAAVPTAASLTNTLTAASEAPEPTALAGSVVKSRSISFAFLCAGLGAGGAFLIVLCVFLFNRSRHREPSLISQALAREQVTAR